MDVTLFERVAVSQDARAPTLSRIWSATALFRGHVVTIICRARSGSGRSSGGLSHPNAVAVTIFDATSSGSPQARETTTWSAITENVAYPSSREVVRGMAMRGCA